MKTWWHHWVNFLIFPLRNYFQNFMNLWILWFCILLQRCRHHRIGVFVDGHHWNLHRNRHRLVFLLPTETSGFRGKLETYILNWLTAVQAVVGSIVWAFCRHKNPRSREMSACGYALLSVCAKLLFFNSRESNINGNVGKYFQNRWAGRAESDGNIPKIESDIEQ